MIIKLFFTEQTPASLAFQINEIAEITQEMLQQLECLGYAQRNVASERT